VPRHEVTVQGTPAPATGRATPPAPDPATNPTTLPSRDAAGPRRRGLAGWPIRRKLVALVAGPLLVILLGGAWITAEAVRQLREAQNAQDITTAASYSNRLAQQLQREVLDTLAAINHKDATGPRIAVKHDWQITDTQYDQLLAVLSDPPGGSWDFATQKRVDAVRSQRQRLTDLRGQLFAKGLGESTPPGQEPPAVSADPAAVVTGYKDIIDAPRQLTQRLGQRLAAATSDGSTVNAADAVAALAEASTAAAQEVTLTLDSLINVRLDEPARNEINRSQIKQTDLLTLARVHASDAQQRSIDSIFADNDRINSFRRSASEVFDKNHSSADVQEAALRTEPSFRSAATQRLVNLDDVVGRIVADAESSAAASARSALVRVGVVGGGALLVLLLVTAFTAAVARSVSVPLRRLRSAAVETANVRLPAAVEQIGREGPEAPVVLPPALPAGEAGGPETAEVARAVDGLTSEAVRLASAQVRLRRSLDDAFVSMSRRSQSMVEKQLAIIDELERTEEDPDQLRNLFRLDHLAARMRRYNDNLLVLAGSLVRTRSNAPVPIADVFRAATSEMEQYERVRLQPVSGAAVAGPAAGGLIHLLAELLDNAAMYSPPTSPILMAAAFTADGGLHLEITDSGVGIPASELAELNMRLAAPGSFDMQVPSRMGLYVVARLAQRGGFGVQLAQRAGAAGTVAEVVVPAHLVIGGSGLIAEPSPTQASLPQLGVPAGARAPRTPARGVPVRSSAPMTGSPAVPIAPAAALESERERDTAPVRRVPAAGADGQPGTPSPTKTPITTPSATPMAASDEPLSPLPSRRPGAALAAGPLAAASSPSASTAPAAPSPFAASAAAPEAPAGNGAGAAAGRAAGGFGTPGRPLAAGSPPATRRAPAAGAPSAATAAAAAAAARVARSGGSAPGAASALFAAQGPATDGRGTPPVTDEGNPSAGQAAAGPEDLPDRNLLGPDSAGTTGSVQRRRGESGAPAAWDATPAATAAARAAGNERAGAEVLPAAGDDLPPGLRADLPTGTRAGTDAEAPPAPAAEPLSGAIPAASVERVDTPIFDTVSTWFSSDRGSGQTERVIDLRDRPRDDGSRASAQRWSMLGDQRWMATNARAAAGPEVAGTTEVGLPRRRPGANLIPSAAAAAPVTSPATRTETHRRAPAVTGARGEGPGRVDADALRGRLSSYQRGLTSARRARHLPADHSDGGPYGGGSGDNDPGHAPGDQGG
jgi:signal transduction histidine kinase